VQKESTFKKKIANELSVETLKANESKIKAEV
jgi:hypothetical protein